MNQTTYEDKKKEVYNILEHHKRIMDTNGEYIGFSETFFCGIDALENGLNSWEKPYREYYFYKDDVMGYFHMNRKYKTIDIHLNRNTKYQGITKCTLSEALDIINAYFQKSREFVNDIENCAYIFDGNGWNPPKIFDKQVDLLQNRYVKEVSLSNFRICKKDIGKIADLFSCMHTLSLNECRVNSNCELWRLNKLKYFRTKNGAIEDLNSLNYTKCNIFLENTTIINNQNKVLNLVEEEVRTEDNKKANNLNSEERQITFRNINIDYNKFFACTNAKFLSLLDINTKDLKIVNGEVIAVCKEMDSNGQYAEKTRKIFTGGLNFVPGFYNLKQLKVKALLKDMRFIRNMKNLEYIEGIKFDYSDDPNYRNFIYELTEDTIKELSQYEQFNVENYISDLSLHFERKFKEFYHSIKVNEPSVEPWLQKAKYDDDKKIREEIAEVKKMPYLQRMQLGKDEAKDIIARKPSDYLKLFDFVTILKEQDEHKGLWNQNNIKSTMVLNEYGLNYKMNEENHFTIFYADGSALSHKKIIREELREDCDIELEDKVALVGNKNMKLSYLYKHTQYDEHLTDVYKKNKELLWKLSGSVVEEQYHNYLCFRDSPEIALSKVAEEFNMSEDEKNDFILYLKVSRENYCEKKEAERNEERQRIEALYENIEKFKNLSNAQLIELKSIMPKIYHRYDDDYKMHILMDMVLYKITGELPKWIQSKLDTMELPDYIKNYDNSGEDIKLTNKHVEKRSVFKGYSKEYNIIDERIPF